LKVGYNELTVGGFQLKSFIFRFQRTIIWKQIIMNWK
jgi:hypothetical protein